MKFYPGGKKSNPIEYDGDKNLNDLMEFVKKYSSNNVDVKENVKKEKVKENKNENEKKKDTKEDDNKNDKYEDL